MLATSHWPPRLSGVADYSWNLAESLKREGMNIRVLVFGQEAVAEPSEIVVEKTLFPSGVSSMRQVLGAVRSFLPDVVCLQFEAHAFGLRTVPHFLPLVFRLSGYRVVLMYHELWGPKWFRYAAKFALLNAPERVVTSSDWHAAGVGRFRLTRPVAATVPIGPSCFPLTQVARALQRARFGVEKEEIILTFFGFVSPEHGVEEAISALKLLLDEGRRIHFSVIGLVDTLKNGYHQRLFALAKDLGVEKHITWHDRVFESDAVSRLLSIADVGILPFRSGIGENNTSFAAFAAAGLPTVTVAGPRSVNIEREGVAVFTAPDPGNLAAAIGQLIDDSSKREKLGNRARAWAQRRSWEQIARAYIRIFEELASSSRRVP
jgi:glycosyltransferase involved in cell wall biosynthesis